MNRPLPIITLLLLPLLACQHKPAPPSAAVIDAMALKRGRIILCGPSAQQLGTVRFKSSCSGKVQKQLDMGIALLHSFEYDEAEKAFAEVIRREPSCPIAYWGVAMSNYHPLWAPPTHAELEKGSKAIVIAQSLAEPASREAAYINALATFYHHWQRTPHAARCLAFEKAMAQLYTSYPDDQEAAVFYALALNGAADPADKTFARQKKAGNILSALAKKFPDHPGITHYIIHSYDYPELASMALPAARKYASIAPSSAHARHMPSHIFTRLGLWEECARANLDATAAARCYAESTNISGHWDEELHGMDYLIYAYLQQARNGKAKEQYDYLQTIHEVHPVNFKVAYAFASIPARYLLENRMWRDAAMLQPHAAVGLNWAQYPWQAAIIHFTKLLGAVHMDNLQAARAELQQLTRLRDTLLTMEDTYKAGQVQIQRKSGEAWILLKEGKATEAVALMQAAAQLEDNTQKHPVTPGEVLPARELLGDMLLELDRPAEALTAYEADLKEHMNRFNGVYGAALAAERCNEKEKASGYYRQLMKITGGERSARPEVFLAAVYLKRK